MTYDNQSANFPIIKSKGIICKTDMGLYDASYSHNYLELLSIYGSTQQVKAIFGLLASGYDCLVTIGDNNITLKRPYGNLRFRSTSIGYGKRHGLIWNEDIEKNTIIWLSPEEKQKALYSAISKRKIPFDKLWLSNLEKILLARGYFGKLQGWGGIDGYESKWEDDAICNLIAKKILKPSKGGKNGNQDSQ